MADVFDKEKRSAIMSAVKGKDTKPEMTVRRLLHASGYRYHTHEKGLPSRPDVFFSKRKKAIFIHGCFWHGHPGCKKATTPKTNTDFWRNKIASNIARDLKNLHKLKSIGISTLILWECEIKDRRKLATRLKKFLGAPRYDEQRT